MTKVITIGCFKGGVGKSTLTEILTYLLAKEGYKVLAVDTDPQSNLTEKIQRTYQKKFRKDPSFMEGIKNLNLENCIEKVTENLDILKGDWSLEKFDKYVIKKFDERAEYFLLNSLLKPIKDEYDYIIIDTRPSTGILSNNAVCASDYVLITSKTEEDSFTSAKKYYSYLGNIQQNKKPTLKFLGLLPYLVNQRGSTNRSIMNKINELFGEDVFKNYIRSSDRVVTWGEHGVTEYKAHDKKTMQMYLDVKNEILEKLESE
ncbi:TPA: ParA family protein [Staphylococcus aureus]|uniref:ParA family protein n=1 Tax=Staphylococcus aureus TaxID=1280 RepID=UPI0022EB046C|nr:ParA family protein [Staphylococcus aureus]MDA3600319.1 ParA family protein [Staphylococcus aureus]MDA3602831.1 ParA family protein [Staphylococcus aureus]MDN4119646.1 ParA family protein [Staphylococcus aureus]HDG8429207.1 ParA family protein [Staphylococcus aureus]HDG8686232.1 ParA family protein [Staphylococcus aureus]